MQVEVIQHPVGQGGLYSGKLDYDSEPFRWVYDCGSNQSDALQRELEGLGPGTINVLFLSHLDSDHIRGVDVLLAIAEVEISEVVLPYLSEVERVAAIVSDIEAGALTGTFLEFAADPARWLIRRGVQIVTFIEGRDDDSPRDDERGEPTGGGEGGGGEGGIVYKWHSPESLYKREINGAIVQRRATTDFINVPSPTNWVLLPYAHRPSPSRLRKFQDALRATYGRNRSVSRIVAEARTRDGRKRLRDCYDALWSNHNLVSMSLYAGPRSPNARIRDLEFNGKRPCPWRQASGAVGWLSTGDSNLASRTRRLALLSHYRRFLPQVSVFVVPHHGAANYFHRDLATSFSNLVVSVAAAGRNGYGHPHRKVIDAFQNKCAFHNVSEVPNSILRMQATLYAKTRDSTVAPDGA